MSPHLLAPKRAMCPFCVTNPTCFVSPLHSPYSSRTMCPARSPRRAQDRCQPGRCCCCLSSSFCSGSMKGVERKSRPVCSSEMARLGFCCFTKHTHGHRPNSYLHVSMFEPNPASPEAFGGAGHNQITRSSARQTHGNAHML